MSKKKKKEVIEDKTIRQQTQGSMWRVMELARVNPFILDDNNIFWRWDELKYCYTITDEIDLLNMLDKKLELQGWVIDKTFRTEYKEALKLIGRRRKPREPDKNWIQFGRWVTIVKIGHNFGRDGFEATSDYFFTNPIPWDIGKSTDTPILNKLFQQWVGKEYVQTLYEIIAYCCMRDYPIHLAFALVGSGRNGKSVFQRLLTKFLGQHNCVSTELDQLLESRFESFKLYRKLACQLGETDWGVLKKTSLFKKLTGGDLIGFEKKNKDPFDDYNYATILINSNSLPTSDDTSEGFYRRWLVLDFPNEFPEGKDILETVPDHEFNNLARKVIEIIPCLLEKGHFVGQGTIEQRRNKYIAVSNPLPFFIRDCCDTSNSDLFVSFNEIFNAYKEYLRQRKKRVVSRKEFISGMENEGLFFRRQDKKIADQWVKDQYFECVCLKNDWKQHFSTDSSLSTLKLNSNPYRESNREFVSKATKVSKTPYPDTKSQQIQSQNEEYADSMNQVLLDWVKDMIPKLPTKTEDLILKMSEEKKIPKEIVEECIATLKHKGDVFEPTTGMIAKL